MENKKSGFWKELSKSRFFYSCVAYKRLTHYNKKEIILKNGENDVRDYYYRRVNY